MPACPVPVLVAQADGSNGSDLSPGNLTGVTAAGGVARRLPVRIGADAKTRAIRVFRSRAGAGLPRGQHLAATTPSVPIGLAQFQDWSARGVVENERCDLPTIAARLLQRGREPGLRHHHTV